jgi:hypothetical protein
MADNQAPMETEVEPATICVKREPDPGREGRQKEELIGSASASARQTRPTNAWPST